MVKNPNNIRYFRELRNISQEEMASKLSIATSTYGKIERGETQIVHHKLNEIANILQADIEDLLLPQHTVQHIANSNIHFGNIRAETYHDNKSIENGNLDDVLNTLQSNQQQLIENQKLILELLNNFIKK